MVPFVINLTRWWSCQPLIHQVSPSLGSSPSPANKSCPGLKLGSYSYRMLLLIIWSMGWCKSTRMFLGFSFMNRGLLCSELSIHISEENVVHSWTNDKVSTNVQPNPLAYLRITMRSISDFLVQFGYVNTLHSVVLLLSCCSLPYLRRGASHHTGGMFHDVGAQRVGSYTGATTAADLQHTVLMNVIWCSQSGVL